MLENAGCIVKNSENRGREVKRLKRTEKWKQNSAVHAESTPKRARVGSEKNSHNAVDAFKWGLEFNPHRKRTRSCLVPRADEMRKYV